MMMKMHKSQMPQTDPCDALRHFKAVVNNGGPSMW